MILLGGGVAGSEWTFVLNPGNIVVTSDVLGYFNFPALTQGMRFEELPWGTGQYTGGR